MIFSEQDKEDLKNDEFSIIKSLRNVTKEIENNL